MISTSKVKRRRRHSALSEDATALMGIDKTHLDDEFFRQPNLIYDVTMREARAQRTVDRAYVELKQFESERRAEIAEEVVEKLTIAALEYKLNRDPWVVKARRHLAELEYKVNKTKAEKAGLYERGRALTHLVDLLKMNYFTVTGR